MAVKKSKTNETKNKRLPKGQRKHIRNLKQAARMDGAVYNSQKVRRAPAKKAGD